MNFDSPQLFLRLESLDYLPPICLPEGFSLHCERGGDDVIWEGLIERAFGMHFSFDGFIRSSGSHSPDKVLFVAKDGKDIATCTAAEKEWFPGEGWLRMVGTDPDARGCGAGRLVCLAALHCLAAHGYHSAALSTDDFRLPAISLYLSLGFRPLILREDHEERWAKVMKALEERKNAKK